MGFGDGPPVGLLGCRRFHLRGSARGIHRNPQIRVHYRIAKRLFEGETQEKESAQ